MTVNRFFYTVLFSAAILWHSQILAQRPPVKTTLRSTYTFTGQTGANICGYTASNREYALFGNSTGLGIVEVTDPTTPQFITQIPALNSQWREVKVYSHYAYITTEAAGQGLQIVNLINLPNTSLTHKSITSQSNATNISRIHSLHIDTAKGYLYAFGGVTTVNISGTPTDIDGAVVFDIKTDPWNPIYVGHCNLLTNANSNSKYIHDGFAINDTLYGGHIYAGLVSIIDFRNKTNPILLSTKSTTTTFPHNVWRSDDHKYIFTTDENAGSYIGAYDVTNASNIKLVDKIRSPADANAIVHNTHYLNGYLVTSWYTEGVTIVDAHRPENLVQVGQYDTWAGESASFAGCWGVYPYLPSGNLILSNYTDGKLFVVTPQYMRACYLEGQATDMDSGLPLQDVLVKINAADADKKAVSNLQGNYYTGQVTAGLFDITFSKTGYDSKTITGVTLSNAAITILNVQLKTSIVPVELIDFHGLAEEKGISLKWQTAAEIQTKSYRMERSKEGKEWETIGSIAAKNVPSDYTFLDKHPLSILAYYRLNIQNTDGSFDFSKTISVQWAKSTGDFSIYPNPVKGLLYLQNADRFSAETPVRIYDLVGKMLLQTTIGQAQNGLKITNILRGGYFMLEVADGLQPIRKRFFVE